ARISGGAGLLGRRYCQALLDVGARVVIGDLDRDSAASLAAELGADALGTQLNVADEASVQATVDAAVQKWRRLDILVNNAALTVRGGSESMRPEDYFGPFGHYRRGVWAQAVAGRLTGAGRWRGGVTSAGWRRARRGQVGRCWRRAAASSSTSPQLTALSRPTSGSTRGYRVPTPRRASTHPSATRSPKPPC